MPIGSWLPKRLNPAETAILFIDLQARWAISRQTTVLKVIDDFAIQVAALGVHNYWIAHNIGVAYHHPQPLTPNLIDTLDRLPADDRMIVDLRRHQGHMIGKHEPGAFSNPHLLEHMQWSGIKHAFGCGYIAGQCVVSTLSESRDAGFNPGLIADLSVDNLPSGMLCYWSRKAVRQKQVPRVRSQALLKALKAGL